MKFTMIDLAFETVCIVSAEAQNALNNAKKTKDFLEVSNQGHNESRALLAEFNAKKEELNETLGLVFKFSLFLNNKIVQFVI